MFAVRAEYSKEVAGELGVEEGRIAKRRGFEEGFCKEFSTLFYAQHDFIFAPCFPLVAAGFVLFSVVENEIIEVQKVGHFVSK
ncbi:hypothetical protein KKD70_02415 [Patescibacteria group bacterium]|nr:hypothetical protein [Patescibacteria group bacterium]